MMESAILKGFSVENYASFADPVHFTCSADLSKKDYETNAFASGDLFINRVSYIYGANGSGKTFFSKILREIQRYVSLSPLSILDSTRLKEVLPNEEFLRPVQQFAFDTAYINKPTTFGIDLIIGKTMYHYEFSIRGIEIVSELLTKKIRRTEKILVRTSPFNKDIRVRSELKEFDGMKSTVKPNSLCLSIAAMLNNPLAQSIVDAIQGINVLNMTAPRLRPSAEEEAFSSERIKKYVGILRKADPTILNMDISFMEEEIARQKIESDDFENREIIQKRTTVGVQTKHAMYQNGYMLENGNPDIDFFKDESLGTVKLFTMLPHLFDALEKGGILILDEIENGLHLSLVKEIVNLFNNPKSNPRNAQLICTSHQPLLVNEGVKRDQVWIITKDSYGKSSLHRLSNLSTSRASYNLANKLMEGALGCNPERFFDN